jgi:hypothetical protein
MATHLSQILTAIESLPVAIGGNVVTVYSSDDIKRTYEKANLPARIVSIWTGAGQAAQQQTLGATPAAMSAQWVVKDLLLLRFIGQGIGPKDMQPLVVAYIDSYVDSIRAIKSQQYKFVGYTIVPEMVEWPQASGRMYDAVTITLTFSDNVQ